MLNNLLFNGKNDNLMGYDFNTNTLTIKDVSDDTYHLTFSDANLNKLTINVINSKVTILEIYKGDSTNYEFTINVDENSNVKRFSVLVENTSNIKVTRNVNNKGVYESMQLDLSTLNIESNENINLIKKEANAKVLVGIYAALEASKKYQTNLNHYEGVTKSQAQIFAVNDDKARVSIFTDGFIKNGASGSIALQEGRIINLSEDCYGIVLPNLHIDENDVQAAHSCSVGSVNKDHLYYLQTRGLSAKEARNILIRGYFNPLLKDIEDENILKEINEVLDKRIG